MHIRITIVTLLGCILLPGCSNHTVRAEHKGVQPDSIYIAKKELLMAWSIFSVPDLAASADTDKLYLLKHLALDKEIVLIDSNAVVTVLDTENNIAHIRVHDILDKEGYLPKVWADELLSVPNRADNGR